MNSFSYVSTERLAAILEREIERRGGKGPRVLSQYPLENKKGAYAANLPDEIAASGLMGLHAAKRRIWAILNRENERVDFDTADKILTALDLSYLWHTELADAVVIATCSGCGVERDSYTPKCQRCHDRKWQRKKYALAAERKRHVRELEREAA